MDKNDIIEYVMNTPHNTNKAVLSSMLNQLTEGGGGGSSDFSTAEVTVQITSAQPGVAIYIPTIISSPMEAIFNNPYNPINSSTPQTVTVPLYKGSLVIIGIWDSGDVTVSISGSVQVMENSFLITGDGTITIS